MRLCALCLARQHQDAILKPQTMIDLLSLLSPLPFFFKLGRPPARFAATVDLTLAWSSQVHSGHDQAWGVRHKDNTSPS